MNKKILLMAGLMAIYIWVTPVQAIRDIGQDPNTTSAGNGSGSGTTEPPVDDACGENKITICHIPSGNADTSNTICIAQSALDAHIAHGDYLGDCILPVVDDNEVPLSGMEDEDNTFTQTESIINNESEDKNKTDKDDKDDGSWGWWNWVVGPTTLDVASLDENGDKDKKDNDDREEGIWGWLGW
jgi:hypothetical protein